MRSPPMGRVWPLLRRTAIGRTGRLL
jgi:hypothetical protein